MNGLIWSRYWRWILKMRQRKMVQTLIWTLRGRASVLFWRLLLVRWYNSCFSCTFIILSWEYISASALLIMNILFSPAWNLFEASAILIWVLYHYLYKIYTVCILFHFRINCTFLTMCCLCIYCASFHNHSVFLWMCYVFVEYLGIWKHI